MIQNVKMKMVVVFAVLALFAFSVDGAMAGSRTPNTVPVVASGGDHCTEGTLGGMLCQLLNTTASLPGIIVGFSYLMGLICGFMFILKLKEHVEGSHQVTIWEPIKRFVAAGAFFAFPMMVDVLMTTIQGKGGPQYTGNTSFATGGATGGGLDTMMVKLVANTMEPIIWLTSVVGWVGGLIFVFIGISRLMKSEQDGHRGPTGIGTVTTFLVAGALFSLNTMVTFLNNSLFGEGAIKTNATLVYQTGLTSGAAGHVHAVFGGILAFAMILGWISITRGLFMVRGISEGNQHASMMAAITHLIGGALAINLGGLISAVQKTLNITNYGINFQ